MSETMDASLTVLSERMRAAYRNGDTESAHSEADEVLVEMLRLLHGQNPIVAEMLSLYDDLEKWYA